MSRPGLLSLVACLFLVYAGGESSHSAMTPEEKHTMRYVRLQVAAFYDLFRHLIKCFLFPFAGEKSWRCLTMLTILTWLVLFRVQAFFVKLS